MRNKCLILFYLVSMLRIAKADTAINLPLKALPTQLAADQLVQVDENNIASQIAEGLFEVGEGFEIIPMLAEKTAWKSAGKSLYIKLRKSFFSDGTQLKAEHVVASLEYCARASESALSVALQDIDGYADFIDGHGAALRGLKKLSDQEIEIHTVSPAPLLIDDLAFGNCYIVKPNSSGSLDLLKGATGTGPYFVNTITPAAISLKKRPGFIAYNKMPDSLVYKATPAEGDFSQLQQWADLILTEEPTRTNSANFNTAEISPLGTYQLVFNNSKPPFQDDRVREAISIGLDVGGIAKGLGWSPERLQAGLFPFGMRGFKRRNVSRNLRRATSLLKAAGYSETRPLKFSIVLSQSAYAQKEAALWPVAFNSMPVAAFVELVPQKELIQRRNSGDFTALRIVKTPGSIDAHRILASYFSKSRYNTPRARLSDCDQLIKMSLRVQKIDARYDAYTKAESCLLSHHLLVPLASLQPGYAYVRKPWRIKRRNRYFAKPYDIRDWTIE